MVIHFEPWINRGKLFIRICMENVYLGNPPGYPIENLTGARLINVHCSVDLSDIKDAIFQRFKPHPLRKVPDFMYLIKLDVDYVDAIDILLDYQMYNGNFNVHHFTKVLAEEEAKDIGWINGWYKKGDPLPNQLEIKIIRARNLAKKTADKTHKSFDPYVVVKLRKDTRQTKTQSQTRDPMFNEDFFFHATDPSTVVHIMVYNRGIGSADELIGQWIITLKWLLADPYHCWHETGLRVSPDRKVHGWFPLQNSKWHNMGLCGLIEMSLHWTYVPEAQIKNKYIPPALTAAGQFEEWFTELLTRWGSFKQIRNWLSHLPILVDVHRVTARNVEFHLQDLFRGFKGRAETAGVEKAEFVKIDQYEWLTQYRPKYPGEKGITLWDVWIVFWQQLVVAGVSTSRSNGAVLQVTGSIIKQFGEQWGHVFRGEFKKVPAINVARQATKQVSSRLDSAKQFAQRAIANRNNAAQFKFPVTAEDSDYLQEIADLCGYLERCAKPTPKGAARITEEVMEKEVKTTKGATFKRKYFELKNQTIFFKQQKSASGSSLFGVTYRVHLQDIKKAIYFVSNQEIILNCDDQGYMTRLRMPSSVPNDIQSNPTLTIWYEKLEELGVNCEIRNN